MSSVGASASGTCFESAELTDVGRAWLDLHDSRAEGHEGLRRRFHLRRAQVRLAEKFCRPPGLFGVPPCELRLPRAPPPPRGQGQKTCGYRPPERRVGGPAIPPRGRRYDLQPRCVGLFHPEPGRGSQRVVHRSPGRELASPALSGARTRWDRSRRPTRTGCARRRHPPRSPRSASGRSCGRSRASWALTPPGVTAVGGR